MGALGVVERFDVVEDMTSSMASSGKTFSVDEFKFEGAPEAFHGRVIVAVAFAAHGGNEFGVGQSGAIGTRGVLDAAVGMEEDFGGASTMEERHGESL